MRRPLKPFVTEYRGNTRRQAGPATPSLKVDAEPIPSRQPEPRSSLEGSRSVPPPQEDSYEAALRAADALFSAPPRPVATAKPAPAVQADDPWADHQPLDVAPQPPATSESPPPPNGGRILRVLDEAPSPELLRLEAERAPKRRGRKPGSKNKPKMPSIVDEAIPAVPALAAFVEEQDLDVPVAEPVVVAPRVVATVSRPLVYRLSPARAATEPARDEKYAWVRTKLKPGERWKRRLPKVAW